MAGAREEGMGSTDEVPEAIAGARDGGSKELTVRRCLGGSPAPTEDYNYRAVRDMIERFGLDTGLSDHALDITTVTAGVPIGACIIERHLTLDRNGGGPDCSFSLEPAELAALCRYSKNFLAALGRVDYSREPSEASNTKLRRSLYLVKDLCAGETIWVDANRSVRLGHGAASKFLSAVFGRVTAKAVSRYTPVDSSSCLPKERL